MRAYTNSKQKIWYNEKEKDGSFGKLSISFLHGVLG